MKTSSSAYVYNLHTTSVPLRAGGGCHRRRCLPVRNHSNKTNRLSRLPSVGSISRSSLRSNVRMAFDSIVISSLSCPRWPGSPSALSSSSVLAIWRLLRRPNALYPRQFTCVHSAQDGQFNCHNDMTGQTHCQTRCRARTGVQTGRRP